MKKTPLVTGLLLVLLAPALPEEISPPEDPIHRPVEYLLEHQQDDGTWTPGAQAAPDSGLGVTVAGTALACIALVDHLDAAPDRIPQAVDKGLKACLAKVWRKKEGAQDFEAINWGQVYTLQLLAKLRTHPRWKPRLPELDTAVQELLPWFYARQTYLPKAKGYNGSWGYSSSFQTAGALVMLKELQVSGIKVDAARADTALSFLDKLRHTKGVGWHYTSGDMVDGHLERGEQVSGRIPVCALASFLWGRGPAEARLKTLEEQMAAFMERRQWLWDMRALGDKAPQSYPTITRPVFFAFFGVHYAGLALKELPPTRRKAWAAALREDLLKVRGPDGTWDHLEDSGSRTYGTAVALIVLKACRQAEGKG